MDLNYLVKQIKQKPELKGISDVIVIEELVSYLKKNSIDIYTLSLSDAKIIIKDVRAILRKQSGMFSLSAEERDDSYPLLKKEISKLRPKSILDLGCGQDPIYIVSKNSKVKYFACDINEGDLKKVRDYFQKNKISGEVFFCDLRKSLNLPKADLCLLLKIFDSIESKGHKLAEKIIKSVSCKYFLISFPTKTLSGKPMNHPQRGWIERLLTRLNFKFETFKSKNEIFYLAEKNLS